MPSRYLASIRWRAALLTSALVAVALALFAAFTVRQMSADARRNAMARSVVAANLLATQTGQTLQTSMQRLQDVADNVAIRRVLESSTEKARQGASAILTRIDSSGRQTAVLWDAHWHVVLSAPAGGSTPIGRAPSECCATSLEVVDGRVFLRLVAAVSKANSHEVLGYLAAERAVDAAASSSLIGGMVGSGAKVFIGNQTGDVWTDLEHQITLPSIDLSTSAARELAGPAGDPMIGALAKIPNTALVLVLALPRSLVMAPVWELFRDLVVTGLVFIGLATIGAALLSARVTRPLDDLTRAAKTVAEGDYTPRVRATGSVEVARLGEAFNAMAQQLQQSSADLEVRARELVASREEARRANAAKDAFLAVLSHELRSPLQAMLGWSQLIRMGAVPADQLGHALEVIDRNARAQLRLVEDLLDVSRIVVGRFSLERRTVDMARIVEAAVESIQPVAAERRVLVQMTLAGDGTPVRGDAGRLQQAVGNLLSNALKFTPAGGRICVSLSHEASGMAIVVQDTGDGIAPDLLPFVFDRLQQGGSQRQDKGLGLGLAIVRQVVELHGGTVTAASEGKGTGATFRLWLPAAPAADAELRTDDAPAVAGSDGRDASEPSIQGMRCLVVDDSPDARDLLTTLLQTRGASVTAADGVSAALAALNAEWPDVILSDLVMPERSGFELIGAIRSRAADRGGTIPAIALTAYAAFEDRDRSRRAGFDAHLVKPVDAGELVGTIARVVRPAGTRDVVRDARPPNQP